MEASICFNGTFYHNKAMDFIGFYCIINTMLQHWSTAMDNKPITVQLTQSN